MANEARVFAEGVDNVIVRQFTVADAGALAKGTMLVANGVTSRLAVAHSAVDQGPLGYTTMSKTANDGITEVGCQRTGVVDAYIDGTVRTGQIAVLGSTANRLAALNTENGATLYVDFMSMVGRFLENGTDGQQVRVALCLG